jgi:hypothetical protein
MKMSTWVVAELLLLLLVAGGLLPPQLPDLAV